MITLFISDIDGCLSEPYQPFNRQRFQEVATYAEAAGTVPGNGTLPAFSICSGRSYPYVEAVSQMLGLHVPVLFESGGGSFDPRRGQVAWHPALTPQVEQAIEEVRRWLLLDCVPGTSLLYDYGKRTQAGVAGADPDEVAAHVPMVEDYVARHFPELCVFHTPISIDVLSASITKKEGIRWLGDVVGCSMEQIAFIGDTHGDLGALNTVGYSFAPANAAATVKAHVAMVTEGFVIDGVLEAYRWCVRQNETQQKKAS